MPSNTARPIPTKAERRDDARAEAARLRALQQTRARRARTLAVSGLAAAVVVLIVVVAVVLQRSAATRETYTDITYGSATHTAQPPSLTDVPAPRTSDDRGGVTVSSEGVGTTSGAPVEVVVYLDFMCPFCGRFDAVNGPLLTERVATGDIAVTYRTVSFLDAQSAGSVYSTRAANAAAVVADQAPDHYPAFVAALFADQPEEGTSGLTDNRIAALAEQVGVPAGVTAQFTATTTGTFTTLDGGQERGTWRTYAPWVAAATQRASVDLGGLSTPTILIDGERFTGDFTSRTAIEDAIDAAVRAARS